MTERRRRALAVYALAIAIGVGLSCRHRAYRGDGAFDDRGWYWGTNRYRLDLGSIDLAKPGVQLYSMAYLPAEHFTLGFEIMHSSAAVRIDRDLPINPRLRLELKSRSERIIGEERPLAEWILSTGGGPAFVYCGGPDETGWDRTPGTAWGCHFTPTDAKQQYTLRVEVLEPDPRARGYSARLIVQGGPPDFLP